MTLREAATLLCINASRVRALVATGQLQARRSGSQWIVQAQDVERRAAAIRAGAISRPMSTRISWACADLLDGGGATWLTATERSRLRTRLHNSSGVPWQTYSRWLSSRQSSTTRYHLGADDLDTFLAETGVVATGVSATVGYRLGLGASGQADAYVTAELARHVQKKYFLIASPAGNLTLRTVEEDWHQRTAQSRNGQMVAAKLMVAVDLLNMGDARSAATGMNVLSSLALTEKHRRKVRLAR